MKGLKETTSGESDRPSSLDADGGSADLDFVPPDGGWGWVVCATATLTSGTVTGFLNVMSIFYAAMLDYFGGGAFETAAVSTTLVMTTYLFCSVGGVLSDRIGIRKVALAGAVLATAGTVTTSFVTRVSDLYVTLGLLVGGGFALSLSQSLVIVGYYFRRHLGLVYSLQAGGGGAFAVMFSLALPPLLDRVGLRVTFLCLAGLTSLLIPSALTWTLPPGATRALSLVKVDVKRGRENRGPPQAPSNASLPTEDEEQTRKSTPRAMSAPPQAPSNASLPTEDAEHSRKSVPRAMSAGGRRPSIVSWAAVGRRASIRRVSLALRSIRSVVAVPANATFIKIKKTVIGAPEESRHGLLNLRIWKKRSYVIWTIACMTGLFGLDVVPTHMVKFAKDKFPECNAELLPLGYGVAMATARLLFGPVADRPQVKRLYIVLHQAAFLVFGTISVSLPSIGPFPAVVACSVLVGLCDGVFFLLIGPIVLKLVGVRHSAQGVGFFLALIALPIAAGPSVAGILYDYYSSYTVAFHVLGIPCFMASFFLCLIPSPTNPLSPFHGPIGLGSMSRASGTSY